MNIEQKEDRRVRKTKKALRESLAELLSEKSIQNISVRELTDKADVHRSTFYANFTDIYDLYNHIEETVIKDLRGIFATAHDLDSVQCVMFLMQYISNNKNISRLVLGDNVNSWFSGRIADMFSSACIAYWQKAHSLNLPHEKLEVYAGFLFSGYLGVIRQWAASDFARPESELVAIIADLDKHFERFVGGNSK